MMTKLRWMAGLAPLLLSASACGRESLPRPDVAASLHEGGTPRDSVGVDTGYFGSGHLRPPRLPADSSRGAPRA